MTDQWNGAHVYQLEAVTVTDCVGMSALIGLTACRLLHLTHMQPVPKICLLIGLWETDLLCVFAGYMPFLVLTEPTPRQTVCLACAAVC